MVLRSAPETLCVSVHCWCVMPCLTSNDKRVACLLRKATINKCSEQQQQRQRQQRKKNENIIDYIVFLGCRFNEYSKQQHCCRPL